MISVGRSSFKYLIERGREIPEELRSIRASKPTSEVGEILGEIDEMLRENKDVATELRESLANFLFPEGPTDIDPIQNIREYSAELNAFLGYLELRFKDLDWKERMKKVRKVYLLHTDTALGRTVAESLRDVLKRLGCESVELRELEGFYERDFERGLKDLMDEIRNIVRKHKGEEILLNPTGGFKPESGAMAVIAAENDLTAYYIHETFKEAVIIPPARELKVRMRKEEKVNEITALWLGLPHDSIVAWILTGNIALIIAWAALSLPVFAYRAYRALREYLRLKRGSKLGD